MLEIIYAGKRSGRTRPQVRKKINQLLVGLAKARVNKSLGSRVVIRSSLAVELEEAKASVDAGLAFEIVPGITSAIAGLAYAGIPVTDRAQNSHVTFFTGHEDPAKTESADRLCRVWLR